MKLTFAQTSVKVQKFVVTSCQILKFFEIAEI